MIEFVIVGGLIFLAFLVILFKEKSREKGKKPFHDRLR